MALQVKVWAIKGLRIKSILAKYPNSVVCRNAINNGGDTNLNYLDELVTDVMSTMPT